MKNHWGVIFIVSGLIAAACIAREVSPGPTNIATLTTIPLPSPMPSIAPGKITASTHTPTPTPITHIDMPAWLSDPAVDVLMINTGHLGSMASYRTDAISLINAVTGERFDIPEEIDARAYFWAPDGQMVGLLLNDMQTIVLIDIFSGNVVRFQISEGMTKFEYLQPDGHFRFSPINARGKSPSDGDFFLSDSAYIWGYRYDPVSPDGRYFIQVEPDEFRYSELVDIQTGSVFALTRTDDEYFDVDFRWFPDSNYLSIVQRDLHPFGYDINFEEKDDQPPHHRVLIYDLSLGSAVTYYYDVNHIEWSPDYTEILYLSHGRDYWGFLVGNQSFPCIFNILSGETKCYEFIRNRHGEDSIWDITWSPDGTRISYIYDGVSDDPHFEYAGLCIVDLASLSMVCPTDSIDELDMNDYSHWGPSAYSWSPNSGFLAFTAWGCGRCDDFGSSHPLFIISADGNYYHELGNTSASYSFLGLWRPPIHD